MKKRKWLSNENVVWMVQPDSQNQTPAISHYRGRFAPSPTGPLHFGSLVAAVGSYLDAKHHQGAWLVRIEDVDTPRCSPVASEDILRTLATFGLHSDEPVIYQTQRVSAYEVALSKLKACGAVYPCCCTRKEIADSAIHGIEGLIYPGTCRNEIPAGREARSWRVRTNSPSHQATVEFEDHLQGRISQHLENEIGDFVVNRADGLFAYQLAVVVDDAFQGITHIVRGADLLTSTARQIHLQHLLELTTPAYMHLPVAINESGEKLSKQTLAAPVDISKPAETLMRVLNFLKQNPPAKLADDGVEALLDWGIQHWDTTILKGVSALPSATTL